MVPLWPNFLPGLWDTISGAMVPSNQWPADDLLVSLFQTESLCVYCRPPLQPCHCRVVYSVDHWDIAFPCLTYMTPLVRSQAFLKLSVTLLANNPDTAMDILFV